MSLATRLSAFFLIAMAVVLGGFSGAVYLLARNYLVGQLDERLLNALDTLEAAVDIEPGGLEWEPADRRMTLGVDHGPAAAAVNQTTADRTARVKASQLRVASTGAGCKPAITTSAGYWTS